jgi:hypothetical protein
MLVITGGGPDSGLAAPGISCALQNAARMGRTIMGRRIAANSAETDLVRTRSKNFLSRRSLKEFGNQWPVVKGVIDLGEGTASDQRSAK